jgi:dUTP pyrophosphatase
MSLRIKVLQRNTPINIPKRESAGAAGYDLYASENKVIVAGRRELICTGIAIAVPPGTYGRIAPRSGMSVKGIDVCAGVVDADYTGEVKVLLHNHGGDYAVKNGDRIAQLIIERIETPPVEVVDDLVPTDRGDSGFGSTGR